MNRRVAGSAIQCVARGLRNSAWGVDFAGSAAPFAVQVTLYVA
ncbi:MAG TPA: hypothetical protein PLU99_08095 [Phycisphaerae bacterium]|jgi:hypothetical protein|nr:hypothetical protein [Phycisphaerae bacterium]HRT42118.1 hypothetical protein [Phycisphaerae bacterium]